MITRGLMSSETDEWHTPPELFALLDSEFHFTLDVASTDANALCEAHYTRETDGLKQPWAGSVWCNPPYGREIGAWVRKAAETDMGGGNRLPDTSAHRYGMVARIRHAGYRGSFHPRPPSLFRGEGRAVS